MPDSTAPVSHDAAVRSMRKAAGVGKPVQLVSILAGIVAVVTLLFALDEGGPGAWSLAVIAAAVCVAAGFGSRTLLARARYHVTVSYAPLRLAAKLVAGTVVFAGAAYLLDKAGLGVAARPLFIAGMVAVIGQHVASATLFQASAEDVRVRRSVVPWGNVDAFVVAERGDTVEIGVRTRADAPADAMPTKDGEVLADLPYRVILPASAFDWSALHWAANQSGRSDIALVRRDAAGDTVAAWSNR
ncbi:hypothetical protein [Tsukamurella pseudospumae]|uniref:Uncharacterized protein n=1 Tax=Tsukamurella pseudospumae TaxID=239498 RepID=A0A137ZCM4_9ACTN|nr:hypothetical protein [Tsukamurella pseudospumae]KXO95924.1 hypothetical protein AXK61_04565 [Tsukamurella pseudospumae]